MDKNLKGELAVMDSLKIKPNYAALGREYGMDWRTVKKYHEGYEGKPTKRSKGSKLDVYRDEIVDRFSIKRVSIKGAYKFMTNKYGIKRIGTYSNFRKYVVKNKLRPKKSDEGHPRYEKGPGDQSQCDWKEDIFISNCFGETFTINVFHQVLKYSRYSHLSLSIYKRFDDVARSLIDGFCSYGGVPKEILFDNMSTVVNTNVKPKKPTEAIKRMSKDFGFKIRFCKARHPETKGTVEARNKIIDHLRAYDGQFETLEELEVIIEKINADMNIEINQETQMSPIALFYKEKEYLLPLPSKDIINQYLQPNKYLVDDDALIRYEGNKYSVNPKLIGEEVTVDVLDHKLYIYYNGKLEACHTLNEKPINYKEDHYRTLMEGKVKESDMDDIVTQNLEMMDKLLDSRKIEVTAIAATKSLDALIAYLSQSEYGKWIINYFANLSSAERQIFKTGINEVLPYVKHRENFMSHIKYSMKTDLCENFAFDCLVNDLMAMTDADCILSDEGYEILRNRYKRELNDFLDDMNEQHEIEEREAAIRQAEYEQIPSGDKEWNNLLSSDDELPFS